MLSIVPLMHGGGLFETGAGGSAPKHVQQLLRENHLRWDSLGEFLALAVSLEFLADATDNPAARVLATALAQAFAPLAERLADDEDTIVAELAAVQGEAVDLGGYYRVDRDKATAVMRPSATFNDAIASLGAAAR